MHQMLIPIAAISASHVRCAREVDALRVVHGQREERQPGDPSQRPLPPRDPPLDGVFGLLPGLAPVPGRARRLPLLAVSHAKIVASPTAADVTVQQTWGQGRDASTAWSISASVL